MTTVPNRACDIAPRGPETEEWWTELSAELDLFDAALTRLAEAQKAAAQAVAEQRKIVTQAEPGDSIIDDREIDDIANRMPGGLAGFTIGWGWRQFARAVEKATLSRVLPSDSVAEILRLHREMAGLRRMLDAERQRSDAVVAVSNEDLFAQSMLAANAERLHSILAAVVGELQREDGEYTGNAPGHGHEVPGVWDSDTGALAGEPCAWCWTWKLAREAIGAAPLTRATGGTTA